MSGDTKAATSPSFAPGAGTGSVNFTDTQRKVLRDMAAWHGQSGVMIAHRTGLNRRAVFNALAALERRGLVTRFYKAGADRLNETCWAVALPNETSSATGRGETDTRIMNDSTSPTVGRRRLVLLAKELRRITGMDPNVSLKQARTMATAELEAQLRSFGNWFRNNAEETAQRVEGAIWAALDDEEITQASESGPTT